MAADLVTTTIECPACSQRIDIPGSARHDGRGGAYVGFDLGQVRRHVEQHRAALAGESDGQAP